MLRTIYSLIDPRTHKVRYIGCTIDLTRRIAEHIVGNPSKAVPLVDTWIEELMKLGLQFNWVIIEEFDDDLWYGQREIKWIKKLKIIKQ